jgi:hypothetical protein
MKFFMTQVPMLFLAGCAAGEGDGAGSTTTQEERLLPTREETTVLKGKSNFRRPPESTLSYGGHEIKGTLGQPFIVSKLILPFWSVQEKVCSTTHRFGSTWKPVGGNGFSHSTFTPSLSHYSAHDFRTPVGAGLRDNTL